ncbi:MAG: alkyl hydroperoxide reductase [Acidobacteriota bacterium]
MRRFSVLAFAAPSAALVLGVAAAAATESAPTYMNDVRPLLARHCVSCHRPEGLNMGGMVAPMSLTTFAETRPWAKSIARAVKAGEMPPWHASAQHRGVFRNERALSETERATLLAWVDAGAPRGTGDDASLIDAPADGAATAWSIGTPDVVVTMPEPYRLADDVQDIYVDIEMDFPEGVADGEHWIEAVEFKPGSSVVHHLLAYAVKPGGSKFDHGAQIGGMAPGNGGQILPLGHGRLIPEGSKLVFEMHYAKEAGPGTAVSDVSQMALRFTKEEVLHNVSSDGVANWTFEIPANAPNHEVRAEHTFAKDVTVISYIPHMHLRGKAARYTAHYPNGESEVLLDVPRYDFNWQTSYEYAEPKRLPRGTRLEVVMWFDNSADNPENPNPEIAVAYGEPTVDEMMIGYLNFTNTEPGDLELEPIFQLGLWDDLSGTSSLSESGGGQR